MLAAKGIKKQLGRHQVLDGIDLIIERQSIIGLVGANGVGKTTLIKCLTGVYQSDEGMVTLDEVDVQSSPAARAKIGYVADHSVFFPFYQVEQLVGFYRQLYSDFSTARFDQLNQTFRLPLRTPVRSLSKGQRTCLAVMLSICTQPDYLLLDEPASGLDPLIKQDLLRLLLGEVEERRVGILISSHNLQDLERICDKVAFMGGRKLQRLATVDELKQAIRKVQVVFPGPVPVDLERWEGVLYVERLGKMASVITDQAPDLLRERLLASGASHAELADLTLEEMLIYSIRGGKETC